LPAELEDVAVDVEADVVSRLDVGDRVAGVGRVVDEARRAPGRGARARDGARSERDERARAHHVTVATC
jgi:hypothetical protein